MPKRFYETPSDFFIANARKAGKSAKKIFKLYILTKIKGNFILEKELYNKSQNLFEEAERELSKADLYEGLSWKDLKNTHNKSKK